MNSEVVSLSTSTPATHDTPSPAPTAGRNRKPVWDLMDVDGKDVLCKRCGKIVHASGRTHVERVEKHVYSRCEKRLSSYKITDIYQSIMNTATKHHTLLEAQVPNPGICVPSAFQLANGLLDQAFDKSVQQLTLRLSGLVVTLETDAWTDINGMAVTNYIAVSVSLSFFLEL
ncbi:hypothetical protein F442_17294 [Phytophthora nicotianae P10297]|uniref:BED-type domain-containing protein n=1 Tax=Phytophthora nicotianae P10297 TaxID=1317064 RepID=W2YJJ9_PHYNI|nr:hypothetical protein F442_17294 [Phytophthora nicotianae P10297]